jgi:hypothetical protein
VNDKLVELEAILNDQACADAVLTKKLVKKLVKRVRKARARLAKADAATRDALIDKLVGKADTLLGLAGGVLSNAVADGVITSACGDQLQAFLGEIRQCVAGIPH